MIQGKYMLTDLRAAVAQLRHAYANLIGAQGKEGPPTDASSAKRFAEGLISPQIKRLERVIEYVEMEESDD